MPSSAFKTCALRSEEHTSELQYGSISYAVSLDRKSTRLNSSHGSISYAVFCLKKKQKTETLWGHHLPAVAPDAAHQSRTCRSGSRGAHRGEALLRRGESVRSVFFFFFNDPATPEIYPLSLPDALPISARRRRDRPPARPRRRPRRGRRAAG